VIVTEEGSIFIDRAPNEENSLTQGACSSILAGAFMVVIDLLRVPGKGVFMGPVSFFLLEGIRRTVSSFLECIPSARRFVRNRRETVVWRTLFVPLCLMLGLGAVITTRSVHASTISVGGYTVLNGRTAINRANFFVYMDQDSGLNHGFPSGFFGDVNEISINAGCLDDPLSLTGCSSDINRLDTSRGTVLQIVFGPLPPGHFAGVNIEEPEHWGVSHLGIGYITSLEPTLWCSMHALQTGSPFSSALGAAPRLL
jgi:hypothetical protein